MAGLGSIGLSSLSTYKTYLGLSYTSECRHWNSLIKAPKYCDKSQNSISTFCELDYMYYIDYINKPDCFPLTFGGFKIYVIFVCEIIWKTRATER